MNNACLLTFPYKGLWAESEQDSRAELERREEFRSRVVADYHSQFIVLEHSFNVIPPYYSWTYL